MCTRLLVLSLVAIVVAGCGGDGSSSSADAPTWPPHFDEPRPGQVSPAEVHWLQGRDFSESYTNTYDRGSIS